MLSFSKWKKCQINLADFNKANISRYLLLYWHFEDSSDKTWSILIPKCRRPPGDTMKNHRWLLVTKGKKSVDPENIYIRQNAFRVILWLALLTATCVGGMVTMSLLNNKGTATSITPPAPAMLFLSTFSSRNMKQTFQ